MIAKLALILLLGAMCAPDHVHGDGSAIVAAARRKIGLPYVWGGGNKYGPTGYRGSSRAPLGFDCSGLAQYAVYQGTGNVTFIDRPANSQYHNNACTAIAFANRQPGDLVFWGNSTRVTHVAIVSSATKIIVAPKRGENVKEANNYSRDRMPNVRRCWS